MHSVRVREWHKLVALATFSESVVILFADVFGRGLIMKTVLTIWGLLVG